MKTPLLERLRKHLSSLTTDEFIKEWGEIEAMGFRSGSLETYLTKKNFSYITKESDGSDIDSEGTFYLSEIQAEYYQLVELFGYPSEGDGYKVDAEWTIKFDDGLIATIYNWKNGKNYKGNIGLPKEKITHWHIGGKDERVVELIKNILGI